MLKCFLFLGLTWKIRYTIEILGGLLNTNSFFVFICWFYEREVWYSGNYRSADFSWKFQNFIIFFFFKEIYCCLHSTFCLGASAFSTILYSSLSSSSSSRSSSSSSSSSSASSSSNSSPSSSSPSPV